MKGNIVNYQSIVFIAAHVLRNNPRQAIMVWGPPGCGKSHMAMTGLPAALGQSDKAVRMFRPSNHDPVDLTGLPMVTKEATSWVTPDFLLELNELAAEYGSATFVLDEINQAVPMMFNTLNGLILDRRIGNFMLDDRVHLVCTGNRQTDKAASNRMPSHTANRLCHFDMESDLSGWTRWAIGAGIPMWIVAFLNFKPGLLNDFDADRRENPTERSWEMFGRAAGENLPSHMTQSLARAFVGEGAAAEVAVFRELMDEMPNPDGVLLDPHGAPVPDKLGAKYAMAGALAQRASKLTFESIVTYMGRMPKEFEVLCVRGAFMQHPEITSTKAFIKWAADNSNVFTG